eukprot:10053980-Alexandrium_andersonii.AAC.1
MIEEQLGLGRWARGHRTPVQMWRGTTAATGSLVRFLRTGLGQDLQWLVKDYGALLPHAAQALLETSLGIALAAET